MSLPVPTLNEEIRFIHEIALQSFNQLLNSDRTEEGRLMWMQCTAEDKKWPSNQLFAVLYGLYGDLAKENLGLKLDRLEEERILLRCQKTFGMIEEAIPIRTDPLYVGDTTRCAASDFAATRQQAFPGVGVLRCPYFDPTNVDEDSRSRKIMDLFRTDLHEGPAFAHILSRLRRSVVLFNDLSMVSRTVPSSDDVGKDICVLADHLDCHKSSVFVTTTSADKFGHSLQALNCSEGIVNQHSVLDGYYQYQGTVRGVWEVKHDTHSPTDPLRQAASEGINIAMTHLNMGVPIDDIVVPVIGSTGSLMQFGAVLMLRPSFPFLVVVSRVLDLTDDGTLAEAASLLCSAEKIVKTPLYPSQVFSKHEQPILCHDSFYVKPLANFFAVTGNLQTSLHHYFKVMSRLHQSIECRKYVLFPICVREYKDDSKLCSIVFPRLRDYTIGLPKSKSLREKFFVQVDVALAAFHTAGVVHMDFFLSNIMWREVEQEVVIKVIDWDAAQFLDEELPPSTKELLESLYFRLDSYKFTMARDGVVGEDLRYLDLSLVEMMKHYQDLDEMCSECKVDLDRVCQRAQELYVQHQRIGRVP